MNNGPQEFHGVATRLSRNPLGIIALFIVLVYGFVALVTASASSFTTDERLPLVYFLVIFPIIVLAVFAWLVSTRPATLYAPSDFRDEDIWFRAAIIPYGQAGFDNRKPVEPSADPSARLLTKGATGSLFWLGHDLMWTADVLLRRGPSIEVLIGLAQARHHLEQVGLSDIPVRSEMEALSKLIEDSEESSLTPEVRDRYASQLGSMIDRIGIIAEASQGNFRVPPHWGRSRS